MIVISEDVWSAEFEALAESFPIVREPDLWSNPSELKAKLAKQMESPVRWTATVEFLVAQGVYTIVEIGPGKVLAGLVKKIDKSVKVLNVSDSESLKATIAALQAVAQAV